MKLNRKFFAGLALGLTLAVVGTVSAITTGTNRTQQALLELFCDACGQPQNVNIRDLAASTVTLLDAQTITGAKTFSGGISGGAEDSVTAFATGGQTSATQLLSTANNHRVSTVVTAGDSVKLPAATVGAQHYVRNDGATSMQVFGQATETINGVASATGISQAPGMGVLYVCTTAGQWTTSPVTSLTLGVGTVGAPSLALGDSATGMYRPATNFWAWTTGGAANFAIGANLFRLGSSELFGWASGEPIVNNIDVLIARAGTNSLLYNGSSSATTATSRTEMNKAIASIADATPTATFTITIPNAAHSASMLIRATCSLGAGGAIGANEATASNSYIVSFTRTAGVNATAAISTAFGGAATAVAGAATVTATVAMSAVSGAVGATNTFTANVTVTKSGGSSANHTCNMYGQLTNANATGITIS